MVARRAGQVNTDLTVVRVARYSAWSGRPTAASLVTRLRGHSRSIDCDLLAAPPGHTPTCQQGVNDEGA